MATHRLSPDSARPCEPGRELAARLWREDLAREHGFEPLVVEGTLPAELRGTLFRNGPGLFGQFGRRYTHPFEADGAVSAVRLAGGRAWGASRITASAGLAEERALGRLRYGFAAPWRSRMTNLLRGRFKNTANTSVIAWQGRLFALLEVARPTELDPDTLVTIGETDLDGVIAGGFSAHPHRVAARHALYNYGLEYGRTTRLHLYELPDHAPARHLGAIELPGAPMLHDFIATETHLVFFVSPVRVDLPRMLLQIGGFAGMFRWRPELGTEIICVPIDRPSQPVRFAAEPFFQWHFTNGFTRGRELVVDYVRYETFDSLAAIGELGRGATPASFAGRAHRATIDLDRRTVRSELVLDRTCEFPTVAPGREGTEHRVTYLGLDDLAALGKLDHATGRLVTHALPDSQRTSEPCFVPRPGSRSDDDGWLLALCHDGPTDRAFLAVYDARRLADGPIGRAWFDHQLPITFHGTVVPAP